MSEAKRERSEAQGGETVAAGRSDNRSYVGERRLTNDGGQTYQYDATGQQTYASGTGLEQHYDGDGLRVKKTENYFRTYYVRSSVLGNQVIVELESAGNFQRGYVYLGGQLLALQQNGTVSWVHQDPITKSQRVTDVNGAVTTTKIDLDPWGGETIASANPATQPQRFTTYTRDANGGDDAQMRRYSGAWQRFSQPDPYSGSYNMADPQSLNRYSYVQNDPVNFVDPTGLDGENPGFIPPSQNGWDQLVSRNPWGFHNETAQRVFTYTLYLGETPFTVIDYNPITDHFGWQQRPRLLRPQNPYDVHEIFRQARERARAKELNKQAWNDYQNCVSKDPRSIEYNRAFGKAALRASLPLPGVLGFARVGNNMRTGTSLLAPANIQILVGSAALNLLIANPSGEVEHLRPKLELAKEDCMKKTKGKYGFTPENPYHYGNPNYR